MTEAFRGHVYRTDTKSAFVIAPLGTYYLSGIILLPLKISMDNADRQCEAIALDSNRLERKIREADTGELVFRQGRRKNG
jgi:hypothetical protein